MNNKIRKELKYINDGLEYVVKHLAIIEDIVNDSEISVEPKTSQEKNIFEVCGFKVDMTSPATFEKSLNKILKDLEKELS